MPPTAWNCPGCGRRVPPTVEVCRCGQARADAEPGGQPPGPAVPARRRSRPGAVALTVGGLLTLVVAAGAWQYIASPGQVEPLPVLAEDAAALAPPEPAASPAVEQVAGPTMRWPDDATLWLDAPLAPRAPPEAPGPTAGRALASASGTLEDLIEAATPAVVLVLTAGGRGAGFFVNGETVLTNAHVVGAQTYVTLRLADGNQVPARVALRREDLDLAVIRVSPPRPGQRSLQLAPGTVRVGQEVLAIGSPHGLQNTVTRGIVSAVRRAGPVVLVQTDAAINPGNSGGPILDRNGRVVAIATLKVGGAAEALGFGVAADHAAALLEGRAAPPAPADAAVRSMDPDMDGGRLDATALYERFVQKAAERANQLDDSWATFVDECLSGPPPGTRGDRGWYVLWEHFDAAAVSSGCTRFYADFQVAASEFHQRMLEANDAARRAGVYPGVCRDLRRTHRLDSPEW